jgi:RimJ/RimL family protein N-acetyltransferase
MPAPVLPERVETARLVLRTWTLDDVPALAAAVARNVEHLRPWMPWIAAEPMADGDRRALVTAWEAARIGDGDVVYGVFLDGHPIGGTGLHRRRGPATLEIGYWIDHDHVRRGFATELAAALTSTALAQPGIDAVQIHHDQANTASRAIPAALGFTLVAEAPDTVEAPGEIGIDCVWRMAAGDWHPPGH